MNYYLSLGSNLGNREQTLRQALQRIEQQLGNITRCSSFFYSDPVGFESANGFCNLCCLLVTDRTPMDVLLTTQAIERDLGRTHKSVDGHYADRTIDIDLIRVFDNEGKEIFINLQQSTFNNEPQRLILPHPLWKQRDFVRIPLAEIMHSSDRIS